MPHKWELLLLGFYIVLFLSMNTYFLIKTKIVLKRKIRTALKMKRVCKRTCGSSGDMGRSRKGSAMVWQPQS